MTDHHPCSQSENRACAQPQDCADGSPGAQAAATEAEERTWWPRATSAERGIQVMLAAVAWIVLIVSFHLTPSPDGLGTHEQLGLQPCTFHQITGLPCPGCGLTTAFAWMAHGHPLAAALTQPLGAVLFCLTVAAAVGLTVTSLAGRSWQLVLLRINASAWLYSLAAFAFVAWIFKIVYGEAHGSFSP